MIRSYALIKSGYIFQYGRTYTTQAGGYRFGFNTQEKVDEVSGDRNHNTAMFWEYDTRLGRRWNVDPAFAVKPWMSSYHAFSNKPIYNIDPNGALDDGYTVDDDGNFTKVDDTGGDDYDVIYANDDHVNPIIGESKAQRVDKNIINCPQTYPSTNRKGEPETAKIYDFSNSENAQEVFKFLNKNTDVEWSVAGGKERNILVTQNNASCVMNAHVYLRNHGFIVDYGFHNHPNGILSPSRADMENAQKTHDYSPEAIFKTFTKSESSEYDESGDDPCIMEDNLKQRLLNR